MGYPVANPFIRTANTGSVAPYYNGTLSHASTSSNGSIRPVADFIAQKKIYTARQQAFFTALNKILPAVSPAAKTSPLVKFLMTPPEQLGGLEKSKSVLYKPEGYLKRFFGQESWKDWSEDRTDLGYAVGNMLGILETGPGRSVEEFVQTLDPQRLENANKAAELFLKELAPVAVPAKSKIIKREIQNPALSFDRRRGGFDQEIVRQIEIVKENAFYGLSNAKIKIESLIDHNSDVYLQNKYSLDAANNYFFNGINFRTYSISDIRADLSREIPEIYNPRKYPISVNSVTNLANVVNLIDISTVVAVTTTPLLTTTTTRPAIISTSSPSTQTATTSLAETTVKPSTNTTTPETTTPLLTTTTTRPTTTSTSSSATQTATASRVITTSLAEISVTTQKIIAPSPTTETTIPSVDNPNPTAESSSGSDWVIPVAVIGSIATAGVAIVFIIRACRFPPAAVHPIIQNPNERDQPRAVVNPPVILAPERVIEIPLVPQQQIDPIPNFSAILAGRCDVEPGSREEQNFIAQINYWFGDGAVLPACQFLGVTLTQVVSREPLDNLDLKSPASRGQLNTELTAILLRWCEQARINAADPRQTFITSGDYLTRLIANDITVEDITILRRICQIEMSPTFDSVAFIQQFTDAARGAAGQCGAQSALQMHRTLTLAGAGRFHAQSGASVNYLEVETKLTVLAYCERIVGQAMQAAGDISENRRRADAHIQNLCAGRSVIVGSQTISVDPIALAKEIVAMLNEIIARDREQTETILTQMGIAAQDVLLLNQSHPVGSALCLMGRIAPQTSIQPTLRSILNWLARCNIISAPRPSSANRNYDHLADLFHQLNAFESDDQQAFYTALAAIPLFGSSPLLWAARNGNRELLETVVRIAGEAAYIPIEGRTLIQWALHENNQELVDCLNRVLANKNWLAAEAYQLLDNPNSAERTRSLRMFSEAAWLREPTYQELNRRIGLVTRESQA